mmetsp:Transcript_121298/g.302725  ORF Transcript_121298/g.302725 Transcript_121298/m.302725 type:complete len:465 (-) Transcript_121298:530-1924(-)
MAVCWLLLCVFAGVITAVQSKSPSYAVGDRVLSKISYKSKKGLGQVVTGEHGQISRIEAKGTTMYAICDFPSWPAAKLKIDDIARIGDPVLDGWKVGDEIVSGAWIDDGEYGSLKPGHFGVVLGYWDETRLHCKFESLRRKSLCPSELIHMKMSSRPAQLLWAFVLAAFLVVTGFKVVGRYASETLESLRRLPGGYQENDKVICLVEDHSLGLQLGDVGVVVGRSRVDQDVRIRCCFGSCPSVSIHLDQIARKGEPLLGQFRAGDVVVSHLPDGSATLGNGQVLQDGTIGKVLKVTGSVEERVTCVFPGFGQVSVLLSQIRFKTAVLEEVKRCRKTSVNIRHEQRDLQKAVLRDWEVQGRQVAEDGEVAEAFLCGLCEDLLLEPVTLVCGHTMCRGCAEAWEAVCRPPFRTPCCAQKVPYKFVERERMHRDIEKLYPHQLARRIAESSERQYDADLATASPVVS